QVGEPEHDRRRVEQQHHRAVHGEQLVELLIGQELQSRRGQLGTHEQRHQPTDEEEGEAGDAVHDPDQLVIGRGDQLVEETPPGAGPGRKRTPNLELSDWGRFGYQQFLHTISGRSRSGRFRILSAAPDATTRGSYIPSYLARLAVRRAARTRPGPAARRCYRRRRDRSGTADTRDRR